MTLQQGIELLQRLQGAVVEVAAGKTRGHGAAHGLPFFRADTAPHIAVGHDIDLVRRSEERRVGKSVDLGGRRIIKKKKEKKSSKEIARSCYRNSFCGALSIVIRL